MNPSIIAKQGQRIAQSDPVVEAVVELYKQWMIGATKPRGPVLPKKTLLPKESE